MKKPRLAVAGLVTATSLLTLSVRANPERGALAVSGDPELDARIERAMDEGLEYLARTQRPTGDFDGQHGQTTAIPALAGMAFLARGIVPGDTEHGAFLDRAVDYILSRADPKTGYMGEAGDGKMYAHCIATLFLSEVSGMLGPERQKKVDAVLPQAVQVILKAQSVKKSKPLFEGGWRYSPKATDSDMSCSGWALMALRSSRLNGGAVPPEAIDRAVAYVRRHQNEQTGAFGYTGPESKVTLTGAAILCLELCGRHDDPATRRATAFLAKNYTQLLHSGHTLYGVYYASQGLFQIGGDPWRQYSEWMYRYWLPRQRPDGSWNHGGESSAAYQTSMLLLAFAVPYRQLPIYQRDETVDETP